MKLWFLTRSLYPYQKTGGGQIRKAQVEYFQKMGYDVVIVMPEYQDDKFIEENGMIKIPFRQNHKFATLLEIIGVYEDYLDRWVKKAFTYLKNRVKKEDIIFATSGGELGMIKLATMLKQEKGTKIVANFHDPLVYSLVHGYKLQYRFHVSREKTEAKYIRKLDHIITSSKSYKQALLEKYPDLVSKISVSYFGYIEKILCKEKKRQESITIAYVGTMSDAQSPEKLLSVLAYDANIKLYFIGNTKAYQPLKSVDDPRVILMDYMPHAKLLEFMQKEVDIGFVSLKDRYFGACVPSKIYEYINLCLPILGALPAGDARDIINQNGFGIAVDFEDTKALINAYEKMKDRQFLDKIKKNIKDKKDLWNFSNQFENVYKLLTKIAEE